MTWDECRDALSAYPRRVLVLATVAHVADACVEHCEADALTAVVWCLDAARRWALGETDLDEVQAAAAYAYAYAYPAAYAAAYPAYAAYAAYPAASAAYAAAFAANADATFAEAAAFAADATFAAADAASRRALVDSLGDAPTEEAEYVTTSTGHLVGATHVWLREGACGGRWHRRAQLTDRQLVDLDAQLEAV